MEQYEYTFSNISPSTIDKRKIPCYTLTKESTYTIYKEHHRYILNHSVTYESILSNYLYHTIIGRLYLIDDMGYKIPCDNIPISLLLLNSNTWPITYTDENGKYSFINYLDAFSSLQPKKNTKPNRKTYIHSLPIIQAIFPLDTTIADHENILIEVQFV